LGWLCTTHCGRGVAVTGLDSLVVSALPDTLLEVAYQSPNLEPLIRIAFACVLVLAACIVAWTLREREDVR